MANIKITLSTDDNINKTNVYSDIDINSSYIEKTLKDRLSVENSISNLLSWRQRERIMNPSLGNSLWKRIFDNFSSFSKDSIRDEVRKILSFEPRIQIENILVETNIDSSEIIIMLYYTIPVFDNSLDEKKINTYTITVTNQ